MMLKPALLACALATPIADATGRRSAATESEVARITEVRSDRIEVRFTDDSGIRVRGGRLVSTRGRDVSTLQRALRGARLEPLLAQPDEVLNAWHARANAARPRGSRPVAHLGLWGRAITRDTATAARVLANLRREPLVEHAGFEPVPRLAVDDIPPPTPDFTALQDYRDVAPLGVGARGTRTIVGARGHSVQVADVELRWVIGHEDIHELGRPGVWAGPPVDDGLNDGSADHGTASLGIITADRNGYGTTGIADDTGVRIASALHAGVADALGHAIAASRRGDMILIELQYPSNRGFVPVEVVASNFELIRTATANGIHVVEVAGNGNIDLDRLAFDGLPPGFLDPDSPWFRDSGAIVCGATDGARTERASFSNHGRRITANGWGERVVTTGYGGLFEGGGQIRQRYTGVFNGTSSGGAIVAGVVASLLGAMEFQDDRELSIDEVRRLLRDHGTPCSGRIGNRPDLVAMLAALGLPDGLSIKPDRTRPGGEVALRLTGPPGGLHAVFAAGRSRRTEVGLNRAFHLPLGESIHVGTWRLAGGVADVSVRIPDLVELRDRSLYFHGLSADAALGSVHVGSSAEAWIY